MSQDDATTPSSIELFGKLGPTVAEAAESMVLMAPYMPYIQPPTRWAAFKQQLCRWFTDA